jgi:hypothetical protein
VVLTTVCCFSHIGRFKCFIENLSLSLPLSPSVACPSQQMRSLPAIRQVVRVAAGMLQQDMRRWDTRRPAKPVAVVLEVDLRAAAALDAATLAIAVTADVPAMTAIMDIIADMMDVTATTMVLPSSAA